MNPKTLLIPWLRYNCASVSTQKIFFCEFYSDEIYNITCILQLQQLHSCDSQLSIISVRAVQLLSINDHIQKDLLSSNLLNPSFPLWRPTPIEIPPAEPPAVELHPVEPPLVELPIPPLEPPACCAPVKGNCQGSTSDTQVEHSHEPLQKRQKNGHKDNKQ